MYCQNNKQNTEPFQDYEGPADVPGSGIGDIKQYSQSEIQNCARKRKKTHIDPIFVEMQFNNNYRDVIAGFNVIAPSQKQVFNQENQPVVIAEDVDPNEISNIIDDFMIELNYYITNKVPDYNTVSNWNSVMPDQTMKSGFSKYMESIGLPANLYADPAKKSIVDIHDITHIKKYSTDSQTKYECEIKLKKSNVDDVMLVKISFIVDKHRDVNEDRNFFNNDINKKENPQDLKVIIEEIFIMGYYTTEGVVTNNPSDDYYKFDLMEQQHILDRRNILKQVVNHHIDRRSQFDNFVKHLDDEGQQFHNELPPIEGYLSYQTTQTLPDSMNKTGYFEKENRAMPD